MQINRQTTEVGADDMLKTYPVKINNEAIPFPDSWTENPKKITEQFETEDGHRKVLLIRSERLSASVSFTVSSRWLKKFKQWRDASTLTVQIYNAVTGSYSSKTMDIVPDSFEYQLVRHSEQMANTDGLWKLSFELEEF